MTPLHRFLLVLASLAMFACGAPSTQPSKQGLGLDCVTTFRNEAIARYTTFMGGPNAPHIQGPDQKCTYIKGVFGVDEVDQAYELDCQKTLARGEVATAFYSIYTDRWGFTQVFESNSIPVNITGPNVPKCVTDRNQQFPKAPLTIEDCKIVGPWNHCRVPKT